MLQYSSQDSMVMVKIIFISPVKDMEKQNFFASTSNCCVFY